MQHLDVGGEEAESRVTETAVFEKYNPLLHGGVTTSSGRGANKRKEVLSIAFVKKYIQYAKNRCHPSLTKGAADWIVSVYSGLRNDDLAGNQKRVRGGPLPVRSEGKKAKGRPLDIPVDSAYARDSDPSGHCPCQVETVT